MNQQTNNAKGVFAGLLPADFAMMIRRPPLGEKLKTAQPSLLKRSATIARAPFSNTMKA